MTSRVGSIFDIVGALAQAEVDGILPVGSVWKARETMPYDQLAFLQYMEEVRQYIPGLTADKLMKGKSTWDVKVINKWFKDNGFSIKLTAKPQPHQEMFYLGCIYSHLLTWQHVGSERRLRGENGKEYDGVYMKRQGVSFYRHNELMTIAGVATKDTRDVAYMMPCKMGAPLSPFDPLQLARGIQREMKQTGEFSALHFPMVDLNVDTSLDWLKGVWTETFEVDQIARVVEAKQQSKLKMNHKGAKAESAAGISVSFESTSISVPMVIDQPFLFWISRQGIPMPLFAAWVDFESWANPGNFS